MTIPTIAQAVGAKIVLEQQIAKLVLAFQASTGLKVHSIPVNQDVTPTEVTIKVQLPDA